MRRRGQATGGGNWTVVALSGEWLFHQQGLRPDTKFIEESLGLQSREFADTWGLYHDPNVPMAYDLFPRLWASDMVARAVGMHEPSPSPAVTTPALRANPRRVIPPE